MVASQCERPLESQQVKNEHRVHKVQLRKATTKSIRSATRTSVAMCRARMRPSAEQIWITVSTQAAN
jgi:hypothetical protein